MARSTLKASGEILNLLSTAAAIGDDGVTLGHALNRIEYVAVNKFLETAGAKWNKKAKRHLFTAPDAREKLLALLETGEIRDDKKHFQQFYTPDWLADELVQLSMRCMEQQCLEPSAGQGAIADAFDAHGCHVTCYDIDPANVTILQLKGYDAYQADFLTVEPCGLPDYECIAMNPPFTGDQDIKHVLHAYRFLAGGGKLAAIMSPGFTFGESRIRREFRAFLAEHGRVVRELPEGTFKEAGTNVRAVIVELAKPRDW
jgi:predicted RNA methylase